MGTQAYCPGGRHKRVGNNNDTCAKFKVNHRDANKHECTSRDFERGEEGFYMHCRQKIALLLDQTAHALNLPVVW